MVRAAGVRAVALADSRRCCSSKPCGWRDHPGWGACLYGMRETLQRPGAATRHARAIGLVSPPACRNPPRGRGLVLTGRRACSRLPQRWRANPGVDAAATAHQKQWHARWPAEQPLPARGPANHACTGMANIARTADTRITFVASRAQHCPGLGNCNTRNNVLSLT